MIFLLVVLICATKLSFYGYILSITVNFLDSPPGVTKAVYHSLFLVYRLHFFLTTELR